MSTYIGLALNLLIIVFIAFARVSGEEVKCGQRYIDLINPRGVNTTSNDLNRDESKRILGGHEANHGAFPWQVRIAEKGDEKASHLCGGVILSEYWILTAGHCYLENVEYTIIVGDFHENELDDGEQEFDVEQWIIHENFTKRNDDSLVSDIALIKISPTDDHGILFNEYVQPVCLPDPSIETDENVMCAASGWGYQKGGGEEAEILRYVHMPILSQETCLETYILEEPYTDSMICAGYKEGGVDTCEGDSGGPLVCVNNGDFTLFGITSWGPMCGTGLGYYANVRLFVPWIIAKMNATFPEPTTTANVIDYFYYYK